MSDFSSEISLQGGAEYYSCTSSITCSIYTAQSLLVQRVIPSGGMAKVVSVNVGVEDLCPSPRALVLASQTPLKPDRVKSAPGEQLTLEDVEALVHRRLKERLGSVRSAFRALDPNGRGLVSLEDFKHVLETLMSLSPAQLNTLLNKVSKRNSVTVDYMQFLRRYSRVPAVHRAGSCSSEEPRSYGARWCVEETSRAGIGGNPRTMIRVFRLFDHNREGRVQRHEFQRILDNYCIPLTDREFQRLWSYYSPNNMTSISYKLFLDNLGFGNSKNLDVIPARAKLELSSQGVPLPQNVKQKQQRAASQGSAGDTSSIQGLTHCQLQSLFHREMCKNSAPAWQTLQACDTTCSGLVKRDILRAVLSSLLFPMNPHTFHKLTSRYGVNATGQVRWKHFLGHFVSPVKQDGHMTPRSDRSVYERSNDPSLRQVSVREVTRPLAPTGQCTRGHTTPRSDRSVNERLHDPSLRQVSVREVTRPLAPTGQCTRGHTTPRSDRPSERPDPEEDRSDLQEIYSRLKEIFHLLDRDGAGWITRADLRRSLEAPRFHLTDPKTEPRTPRRRLAQARVRELLNTLDPEHAGVVPLASLERLNPSVAPPPPSPTTTAEPPGVTDEAGNTQAESLFLDRLCERIGSVLAALGQRDPERTGHVQQEDLRKVLLHYAGPVPQAHFRNCTSWVCYRDFLRNVGVPLQDERNTSTSCSTDSLPTERRNTPPHPTPPESDGRRQTPPRPPEGPKLRSVLDIVFKRMRERLEQRRATLAERIQATTHSPDGTLSERDLRKILEDSWITLEERQFHRLTGLLGFKDGRIDRSAFLAKYDEFSTNQDREGERVRAEGEACVLTAEEFLAAMKARIQNVHGVSKMADIVTEDNLTAFRLMDRNGDGVVDARDFRELYKSLGLVAREREYQRTLRLIGLRPGANLNYAEFCGVVENGGKQRRRTPTVVDQLHEQLASDARYRWAAMSKALRRFDEDGRGLIFKKGLRDLLFTYNLPLRPDQFDQIWSRYDPEGRGCVTVAVFLERLGVQRDGESGPLSQAAARTVERRDNHTQASCDAASLDEMEQILQNHYRGVSDALTRLDRKREGTVTMDDLLSVLQTYKCSVQRDQLRRHLRRLKVSMDDNCRKLAYLDFLSAFNQKEEKEGKLPPDPPHAVRQVETLAGLSPDQALARTKELVGVSASALYKAFSTFDPCGTGTIRALEFRRVLESFCARLSDNQYRHLLNKLELNREHQTINWKDFLNKFKSPGPLAIGDGLDRSGKAPPIAEVLRRIQEVVSGHLDDITKAMVDLDRAHNDTISKEEFRRLCDRCFTRLTSDQVRREKHVYP
ncbi:EF-hand calcium-binding domain-containing protein 6-like [Polymixia lowei]